MSRDLSFIDKAIVNFDSSLRTLVPGSAQAKRPSPARDKPTAQLSSEERKHIAGLMRVNHAGEVCAQALYQGQAIAARLPLVREEMQQAAAEELDHLQWCEERLTELHSQPSLLNPIWYGASFGLGVVAGVLGDKWSLGFVAATEEQVCKHLEEHLEQLPVEDKKTRAILEQMHQDEARHGEVALQAGGVDFPAPVKNVMTLMSKVMTRTAYRL